MRGGEQQARMDRISVEGNLQESGFQAELKSRWVPGGRCEGERVEKNDCLGPVIRGSALQFEFDCLLGAHSDQDVAGSDSLPVGDIALTTGSHWCAQDRAAGRRGNKG
jgi:hypothetical protein